MAASDLPRPADHPEHTEKWKLCTGEELLSIGSWNTGVGGNADCEDIPRKSIDKRLPEHPIWQKRGNCALSLPSDEDGFGQSPKVGQGTSPLWVLRAES